MQRDTRTPTKKNTPVQWRNRIVGYSDVEPESLLANPDNWRVHPKFQQQVVGDGLDELGWLQDVIVNKRTSDEWPANQRNVETVVDGHLRVTLALRYDQPSVPVKFVDLTPKEEKLALLILDPSSTLAAVDAERLEYLLSETQADSPAMQKLFDDMAKANKLFDQIEEESSDQSDEIAEQWMIIIECDDEDHQAQLLDRFVEEGLKVKALMS